MASNLPDHVLQAGSLLQNPLNANNADYRRTIIEWGRRQIEAEYPENPLWAPLNPVKKKLALMEWDRIVRTNGCELRNVVAGAAVEELKFQLQRRQAEILAQDAERRRREQMIHDGDFNLRMATELANRELERQKELIRLQHELEQRAEDAASRRRIDEEIVATDREIRRILIEAVLRASGASTAEETIRATESVNDAITRIRHNPDLSPDEQHVQIKALLDTLPHIVRNLRPHDV